MNDENKVTIVMKTKESILQSGLKDLITLATISLCVYVSLDSSWWTLVTGLMFIAWCGIKISSIIKKQVNVFDSKDDAIEYLNKKE